MSADKAKPERRPDGAATLKKEHISPLAALQALLKNYFFAIVGAAVVALVLRVYVMEAFRIPTDLMAPMLLPGDHIFVNKLAGEPARGDVVIFSMPNDPTKDYIKRVVALAGDTIEIRDGSIILNGKNISRPIDTDVFEESLDQHKYQIQWTGVPADARRMVAVTVPPHNVFVLGDNRAKGQDSRTWGFLPASALKGRASLIWFSMGSSTGVRWSRILKKVE